jgi:hypothetical protein
MRRRVARIMRIREPGARRGARGDVSGLGWRPDRPHMEGLLDQASAAARAAERSARWWVGPWDGAGLAQVRPQSGDETGPARAAQGPAACQGRWRHGRDPDRSRGFDAGREGGSWPLSGEALPSGRWLDLPGRPPYDVRLRYRRLGSAPNQPSLSLTQCSVSAARWRPNVATEDTRSGESLRSRASAPGRG